MKRLEVLHDFPAGKSTQIRALGFYTFSRILIGITLLLWVVFSFQKDSNLVLSSFFQFYLTAFLFLTMGTTAFYSNKYGSQSWFIWSQFVFDAIFISLMLASGSSPQNPFLVLYGINILAAVSLTTPNNVFWVTVMDVSAYTIVQLSAYFGILDWEIHSNRTCY